MNEKLLKNTQMIRMIFIKNIKEYNPNKKRKILIIYNDVIADIHCNNKLNTIVQPMNDLLEEEN